MSKIQQLIKFELSTKALLYLFQLLEDESVPYTMVVHSNVKDKQDPRKRAVTLLCYKDDSKYFSSLIAFSIESMNLLSKLKLVRFINGRQVQGM